MADNTVDRFVDSWGSMGSLWGVNTSVARVHGLLIASDRPWCLDDLAEKLAISKSNVSMCIKELRAWGVIRRVMIQGERREFWTCEPDVWKMLFSILRERKKREFDPARTAVAGALKAAREESSGVATDRPVQQEAVLNTMDRPGERVLSNEDRARDMLHFLVGAGNAMG